MKNSVTVSTGNPKVDAAISDIAQTQIAFVAALVKIMHRQNIAGFEDIPAGMRAIAKARLETIPHHPLGEARLDTQMLEAFADYVESIVAPPPSVKPPAGPKLRVVD